MQQTHHEGFKMRFFIFFLREIAVLTFLDISRTSCFDLCCDLRVIALQDVKSDQRRHQRIEEHQCIDKTSVSTLLGPTSAHICT